MDNKKVLSMALCRCLCPEEDCKRCEYGIIADLGDGAADCTIEGKDLYAAVKRGDLIINPELLKRTEADVACLTEKRRQWVKDNPEAARIQENAYLFIAADWMIRHPIKDEGVLLALKELIENPKLFDAAKKMCEPESKE